MRLIVENRFALFGLVVVALAALFGVAFLTGAFGLGRTDAATAEPARVESALRVCPAPQGEDRLTRVAAFAPESDEGESGGSLVAEENAADAEPLGELSEAGRLWSEEGGAGGGTVVRATGALAAGLEVAQVTVGEDGSYATELRCTQPSLSTWFAAPGGAELDELTLNLTNVDDTPATVNVDLYATDGPAYSDETRGITVDPHDTVELSLNPLIESTEAVAVHVRTNSGRVAPALFAERSGSGSDWVPPTSPPAKRHVIPGVPSGNGAKRLIVAAPGNDPATASVRVITPEGDAEHEALDGLDIPPAASAALSLEGPLDKEPGTVVVESERPIVVGLALDRAGGDDTAYTAAVPPLEKGVNSRAVLPANPEGTATELLLGAPGDAASVRVTPVLADGTAGEVLEVEVEAGRTARAEPESPGAAHAWIVETSGPGPVHAARVLTDGSGDDRATAVRPLPPAPAVVPLPPVSDSLTSVVR
ncbi:hypothetical protein HDA32_004785 [Spinactinospora alkalitolerans]|uniref:Secreted protein n=1 Tax=Spinactinospora alkalitolerans TaxID=687207 RepID=A0A852U2A7_9ACTN|nr:DUF5719 family protein [Spinactinospora alkalitolerans]NYE49665.1 hypothetical protein [Spinactinospora alkalitolerans]